MCIEVHTFSSGGSRIINVQFTAFCSQSHSVFDLSYSFNGVYPSAESFGSLGCNNHQRMPENGTVISTATRLHGTSLRLEGFGFCCLSETSGMSYSRMSVSIPVNGGNSVSKRDGSFRSYRKERKSGPWRRQPPRKYCKNGRNTLSRTICHPPRWQQKKPPRRTQ
ncbi:hypothetical protein PTI98_013640 [Pleurotus ostreatus]|nr:hypothetical protein PTI98_013640 [Pleurotus ostreatus]